MLPLLDFVSQYIIPYLKEAFIIYWMQQMDPQRSSQIKIPQPVITTHHAYHLQDHITFDKVVDQRVPHVGRLLPGQLDALLDDNEWEL